MSDTVPIRHPSWLTTGDFTAADEPLRLFASWFEDAKKTETADATAMALATVDADGLPNVKGFDERGFVFYSNDESQKGHELKAQPKAALAFNWDTSKRQVRVRGPVEIIAKDEADAYFASRARLSQIGAWASKQSAPLESRLAKYSARYAIGHVPRPPFWLGYRVVPLVIEFWHDRPYRLHDRIEFRRENTGASWIKTRLYP